MQPKFITGDKVRIVSGGPEMTVRGIHFDVLANKYSDSMFDCIWFETNKEGKREVHYCPFYTNELIIVEGNVSEKGNKIIYTNPAPK